MLFINVTKEEILHDLKNKLSVTMKKGTIFDHNCNLQVCSYNFEIDHKEGIREKGKIHVIQ